MKSYTTFSLFLTLLLAAVGCKKFVEAPLPNTQLVGQSVYSSNNTAASAVTGLYEAMVSNSIGGNSGGISALVGLSADDFWLYPGATTVQQQFYLNMQTSTNPSTIWNDLYNIIYQANSAIDGINSSSGVTASMKQQLVGEAKVVRAFSYFYLVNLYGDVPLILTTSLVENEAYFRSPSRQVYEQVISDLHDAQADLNLNYLAPNGSSTTERVRPNWGTATALLARVFLYKGMYDSAETAATAVISDGNYTLVQDLDSAFLANNTEAIWQLEPPNNGFNAGDGQAFLLNDLGGPSAYSPYVLSDSLEYDFEPGDLRAIHWTDSMVMNSTTYYFPYKYKLYYTGAPPQEYPTLMRLAEQYLIRAEARAQLGHLVGPNSAESDIDVIRQRAGLPNTGASTFPELMTAILNERRFELFTEYGHRWLDLKRTNTIDAVMSVVTPAKGGNWTLIDTLYPIPKNDILSDSHLTQNPGYN